MARRIQPPEWLRHAFAVEPPGSVDLTRADRDLIDRICREIVRRRLATPALFVLEMHRPLNYLSAQMLHVFEPAISVVTDTAGYNRFAHFLAQRGSIDYLAGRIEALAEEKS
jgi:hypothetical protein